MRRGWWIGAVVAAAPGLALGQGAVTDPAAGEAIALPAVEAVGAGRRAASYAAPEAAAATRTDTPIRDLPQSVTVVPPAVLRDLSATRVEDALTYAGGIGRQNNFGGQTLFGYSVRGFATSEFYRNGFPVNRGYQPAPDAVSVEQIEILRGPAAALYGRGDPGGTFNITTKQPQAIPSHVLGFQAGSFGLLRGTVDSTGPVAPGSAAAYRVTAATERGGSFRDKVEVARDVLAPSLRWGLGPETHVTLEGDFIRNDQTFDRGVVAVRNRLGAVPITRFLGEAERDGRIRNEWGGGQLRLEHRLGQSWLLRTGIDYRTGSMNGYATEVLRVLADGRTALRERQLREYNFNTLVGRAEVTGALRTGTVGHTLLVGIEAERLGDKQAFSRSNTNAFPYAIDLLAPRYGLGTPPPLTRRTDFDAQSRSLAVFAQDQLTLTPTLKALVGIRVDHYDQEVTQRTLPRSAASQHATVALPRAGLVWQPTPPLSLYASAGRTFRPNAGVGATGAAFAPEEGVGYEVGARWETPRGLAATFGLFHIERENVLTPDPSNAAFSVTAGQVRSRGFDVNLSGDLTRSLRLIGGYAYVDAAVTRDTVLRTGTAPINIPRHAGSLLAVHQVPEGRLEGLGLGLGVNAVGSRSGDGTNSGFRLPAYATLDALAYYDPLPNLRLALNLYNVTDAETYERSLSVVRVAPGRPRTVVGSLTLRF